LTKQKLKELQNRIDEVFEKNFADPAYRKSHCLSLSKN